MVGVKKVNCHCGEQATYGSFVFDEKKWNYNKTSIHCKNHRESTDLWLMAKCENCAKGKASYGVSHNSAPFLCTKCNEESDLGLVQCPFKPCFKCGEIKGNKKGKNIAGKYNCRECVGNNTTLPRVKKDGDCQHCFNGGKQKPTEYAYILEDGTRLCGTCHSKYIEAGNKAGISRKSKCECGKEPAYKIGTNQYCGKCFDKLPTKEGAKRTKHGCYMDGCLIVASIKLNDGLFSCKDHKNGQAIGHTSLKCKHVGCDIQPWYGGSNDKTRKYCKKHAEERYNDEVYDFHKKCIKCNEGIAIYRKKGGSYDYCSNCREEGMENSTPKCIEENCNIQASYGKKGESPGHCAIHSTLDEVHLYTMCDCGKVANYGHKKRTHCAECKSHDMYCITAGKCIVNNCYEHGLFGKDGVKERYCSTHKLDDMYDMHHKRCVEPECHSTAYKGDKCSVHSRRPTKNKDKENELANILAKAGVEFKRGLIIESGQFGLSKKYELDFLIYNSKRILILECDECQHRSDKYKNDNLRMYKIANQYKHVTFIRFNPDSFRINGKLRKPSSKNRIQLLLDVIKKEQKLILDEELRIVKICYDNQSYSGADKLDEYGIQIVDIEEFNAELPMMGIPYHG